MTGEFMFTIPVGMFWRDKDEKLDTNRRAGNGYGSESVSFYHQEIPCMNQPNRKPQHTVTHRWGGEGDSVFQIPVSNVYTP